jgi:hypothetical protein
MAARCHRRKGDSDKTEVQLEEIVREVGSCRNTKDVALGKNEPQTSQKGNQDKQPFKKGLVDFG